MSAPTASFNGTDLATAVPGLRIVATDPYRMPNRVLTKGHIASSDKSVNSSAYYHDKKLNVTVEIGRNTRELLDDAVDTLYAMLQDREAALVLSYGSTTRQWTATLASAMQRDVRGGHTTVDIEFDCADPFGIDVSSTQLFTTALTGGTSTTNFVVAGTAMWQQPTITITLSALTDGIDKIVTLGNSANGQSVSIRRTWTAGDVLVVDARLKKVTVNDTEVAFSGSIPEWRLGAGSVDYSDQFTTRTRTMVGSYYKRYV